MKKKIKKTLLTLVSLMGVSFLNGCGNNSDDKTTEHTHEFTNYVSDNNATCTADGTKTAKCNGCDVKDTKTDTGSKKEHTFATTYSHDETNHWYASTCGCDVVSGKEAHTFGEPTVVEATSKKKGSKNFTCKCGYSYSEEIPYVFTEKVAIEATFRAPATCTEPASYFYTDKDGNLGKEYFYVGETIDHDYNYGFKNGRVRLTCKNCDFDSSKDYSGKKDNELTSGNVTDIILNSSFGTTYSCEYYEEYLFFMPGKSLYLCGDPNEGLDNPYTVYFDRTIQVNNDDVYLFEYCNKYENNGEYLNDYQNSGLYGKNNDLYESINLMNYFGNFKFEYNTQNGMYEVHCENYSKEKLDITIGITNKKISYYSVVMSDRNVLSLTDKTAPQKFLDMLENFESKEVSENNGVYTIGINECEHKYCFHNKDGLHDRAYMVCEYCGYTTLDCGDYSNVDDDKLTNLQLKDLLLNTEYTYFAYNNDGSLESEELYYCNNGLFIKFDLQNELVNWNLYKSVNDMSTYYEVGESDDGLKNNIISADIVYSSDSWVYPLDSYSLVYLDYRYDSEKGLYVNEDNGDLTTIKVEDGKIVDIFYRYSDQFYYETDLSYVEGMSRFNEEFSIPFYTSEDHSEDEERIYLKRGEETFQICNSIRAGMNTVSKNFERFLKENYGYEVEEDYTYYQQIDTKDDSLRVYSSDMYGFTYYYNGDVEFRLDGGHDRLDTIETKYLDDGVIEQVQYSYAVDLLGNIIPSTKTVSTVAKNYVKEITVINGVEYFWSEEDNDYVFFEKFHTVKDLEENYIISSQTQRYNEKTEEFYLSEESNRTVEGDLVVNTYIKYSLNKPDGNETHVIYKTINKTNANNMPVYYECYQYSTETQSLCGSSKSVNRFNGFSIVEEIQYKWSTTTNDWYVSKYYLNERVGNVQMERNFQLDYKGDVSVNTGSDIVYDNQGNVVSTTNYTFDRATETWVVVE